MSDESNETPPGPPGPVSWFYRALWLLAGLVLVLLVLNLLGDV